MPWQYDERDVENANVLPPRRNYFGSRVKQARLTEEQVRTIRQNVDGKELKQMAREYGVVPSTIFDVVHYRSWKHVGV